MRSKRRMKNKKKWMVGRGIQGKEKGSKKRIEEMEKEGRKWRKVQREEKGIQDNV